MREINKFIKYCISFLTNLVIKPSSNTMCYFKIYPLSRNPLAPFIVTSGCVLSGNT